MKASRSGRVRIRRLPVVMAMLVVCCAVWLPAGEMQAAGGAGTAIYLPAIRSGIEGETLQETPESGDGGGIDPSALPRDGYTLWRADFESGSFPGGIVVSGSAWPALTSRYAHSGRNAAALLIMYANGLQVPEPAVKLTYNAREEASPREAKNLPDVAYYSAYYYFPQIVISRW